MQFLNVVVLLLYITVTTTKHKVENIVYLLVESTAVDWLTVIYVAGICVACQLTNGQSELLQLALPSALLSAKQVPTLTRVMMCRFESCALIGTAETPW